MCEWEATRTDSQGRIQFKKVSPGTFLVRAEYPGGEFHQQIKFEEGKPNKQDLMLTATPTVGIRWALQTKVGSKDLVGEGVVHGEAHFSAQHASFLLERGGEVRKGWGSDFMLRNNLQGMEKQMLPAQLKRIQEAGDEAFFFWLADSDSHPAGLHLESSSLESIEPGKEYTVRCVKKDLYAKIEIISVSKPLK